MALLTPAEIDAIDAVSPFDDDLTKLINHIREQDKALVEARELLAHYQVHHARQSCILCERTAAWLRATPHPFPVQPS